MLSALRSHVTYANVVATLALVFAMSGGALAANHYLINSTKQINPKVLKALQGKSGAPGTNGAAGPQGPIGPTGSGAVGKEGPEGHEGKAGTNGESVTSKAITGKEGPCEEGGSKFEVDKVKTYACNGSPWTVDGTLPPGRTETGTWSFYGATPDAFSYVPISFPVPLSKELTSGGVHFINAKNEEVLESGNKPSTECKGTVAKPTAEPGNLCVYVEALSGVDNDKAKAEETASGFGDPENGGEGVGTTGVSMDFFTLEEESPGKYIEKESEGEGDWAVTAEKES